ncbi:gluconokinase [Ascoidea rubescens DSM 1968]|uniref:Gluconokinase n=1 Tax=Ascoidea rubescens DSM 1968 TaxID=1344418 RepID=A0A1D2VIZ6_9ASCO|nr:carbohydrate kinase [Ascoidea rubescens DSM 1968]ODV61602.1 carbohydrate kinase [Ascoidea rubescens DSM 1968]
MKEYKKTIIISGASGCGKSSVALELYSQINQFDLLHQKLVTKFIEGDDLHSMGNIRKMSSGIPLNDEDRIKWLKLIYKTIYESDANLNIATCSLLKKKYRDFIIGEKRKRNSNNIDIFFLYCDYEKTVKRVQNRSNHFMKENMLRSQFDILELPNEDDEQYCHVINVNNKTIQQIVNEIHRKILPSAVEQST